MSAPTVIGTIASQTAAPGDSFSLDCSTVFDDIDARTSITWSAISGMPTGMTLSADGELSGTPTTPGTYDIVIRVSDANNAAIYREFTRRIIVAGTTSAANIYYVNRSTGSDTNNGTSSGTAWRTLSRASQVSWQSGGVEVRIAPGVYPNDILAPQNAGNSSSEKITYTVDTSGGDGVVSIVGPTSGSYDYGIVINVANIKITRPNANSYIEIDGGVIFGVEVVEGQNPDIADSIRFGMDINAANFECDIVMRRTAGWVGVNFGPSANNWNLAIDYDQHGTCNIGGGEDSGDMTWVPTSMAGEAS